jgi:hypothetical protein
MDPLTAIAALIEALPKTEEGLADAANMIGELATFIKSQAGLDTAGRIKAMGQALAAANVIATDQTPSNAGDIQNVAQQIAQAIAGST